jgi:hypothetical protein
MCQETPHVCKGDSLCLCRTGSDLALLHIRFLFDQNHSYLTITLSSYESSHSRRDRVLSFFPMGLIRCSTSRLTKNKFLLFQVLPNIRESETFQPHLTFTANEAQIAKKKSSPKPWHLTDHLHFSNHSSYLQTHQLPKPLQSPRCWWLVKAFRQSLTLGFLSKSRSGWDIEVGQEAEADSAKAYLVC